MSRVYLALCAVVLDHDDNRARCWKKLTDSDGLAVVSDQTFDTCPGINAAFEMIFPGLLRRLRGLHE